MCTSNLNLIAIANPGKMVCYSLEVDAALTTMISIFVPVDENLRTKKKRRRRRIERKKNKPDRESWNWMKGHGYLLQVLGDNNSLKEEGIVMAQESIEGQ